MVIWIKHKDINREYYKTAGIRDTNFLFKCWKVFLTFAVTTDGDLFTCEDIFKSFSRVKLYLTLLQRNHWWSLQSDWLLAVRLIHELLYFLLFTLLPEKFLPFDWLRAEVFQLKLKYLHVKITVTMVTPNHQIISSHERFLDFEIRRFKN